MSLFSWLAGLLVVRAPAEEPVVRAYFERTHPEWGFGGCSTRAVEPNRTVIAVFYRRPDIMVMPAPYLLYAVYPGGAIEELACEPGSPYWIRGRK